MQRGDAVTYAKRVIAIIAGLAIIAWVTARDFSDSQFVLWIACCAAGAALLIWGVKGLMPRRAQTPSSREKT